MENLIHELLKELTNNEKIQNVYENFLKLENINIESKEDLQKFINNLSNSEE